jgi:hypothetical protein
MSNEDESCIEDDIWPKEARLMGSDERRVGSILELSPSGLTGSLLSDLDVTVPAV